MTIRETIEAQGERLTTSDRRLVQVLLASPANGAFASSVDVAKQAGVHPATAVRLARKLGFDGYSELRAELQAEFIADNGAERVERRLAKAGDGSILQTLIDSEVRALQSIPDYISQEQIEAAASLLIDADDIAVSGIGHATALADLFARRLNRSGYRSVACQHMGWEIPEKIMGLGPDGLLVSIVFRSIPEDLPAIFEFVRSKGASVFVISDLVGPFIRPRPDVLLAASRGAEGESQSLTVPMAICNALILELSRSDGGKSVNSLKQLAQARDALGLPSRRPAKAGTRHRKSQ